MQLFPGMLSRLWGRQHSPGPPLAPAAAASSNPGRPEARRPRLEVDARGEQTAGGQVVLHPASQGTLLYLYEVGGLEVASIACITSGNTATWQQLEQACPCPLALPAAHEVRSNSWLCGAAAIWAFCEERCPEYGGRELGRPASQLSGGEVVLGELAKDTDVLLQGRGALMAALSKVITSRDAAEAAAAMQSLQTTLQTVEDWLAEHEMPFVGGDEPDATDCYLVAELAHALAAGLRQGRSDLAEEYPRLQRYQEEWGERSSWKAVGFSTDAVKSFWRDKAAAAQAGT